MAENGNAALKNPTGRTEAEGQRMQVRLSSRLNRVTDGVTLALGQSERRALILILGLALIIQLLLAPYRGFLGDLQLYLAWGSTFLSHPLTIYRVSKANYPPLVIYIAALLVATYRGLGSLMHHPAVLGSPDTAGKYAVIWFWAKLPIVATNIGATWLIYKLARAMTAPRWALLAAAAYGLAPALLLDGAVWGQTDGVPVFLILAAIYYMFAKRPLLTGALFGLALMIKPQPVVFLPVLIVYLLVTDGWRDTFKLGTAAAAVMLVLCLPYLIPPHPQLLYYYQGTMQSFTLATKNAFNLWYIIDPAALSQTRLLGPLTADTLGLVLFIPVMALALALVWYLRSTASLFMAMGLVAVGFFDVTTLQHERYLFQALPFLLLSGLCYRPFVRHYALASVTVFLNMFVVAVASNINLPVFTALDGFFAQHPQLLVVIAYLNVQLLVAMIVSSLVALKGNVVPGDFPGERWVAFVARNLRAARAQWLPR